MGEATDRVSTGGGDSRAAAARIDADVDQLREELSRLVDELDRRRQALDPRVQIRRHPLTGAMAGGLAGLVGGFALAVVRRRRGWQGVAGLAWTGRRPVAPSIPLPQPALGADGGDGAAAPSIGQAPAGPPHGRRP